MGDYPKVENESDIEIGSRVEWRTYVRRQDADLAAIVAVRLAAGKSAQGYDFGYCCPGNIESTSDGRFRVCCP